VPEHQAAQVRELVDCKVGEGRGLVAFLTHDAYAYVGLLNHVDIVGAITDSERDTTGDLFPDCLDKFGFLTWRGSVDYQTLGVKQAIHKMLLFRRLVKEQLRDGLS
jgi:hypothetical protein